MPLRSIHLWVPGISETGGIQHYSWCLAKALRDLFPADRLIIFSRNDPPGSHPGIEGVEMRCFGHWRGTLGHALFAASGLSAQILDRPSLWLASHPAFAKAQRWLSGRGVPSLVAAHGIEVWGAALQRLKEPLAAMTGMLPVSDFTRQILIREGGLHPDRIAVVADTFREHAFAPGPKPPGLLQRHQLSADQPVLLTVSRLAAGEAYKGHDRVIAALPLIRARHPSLRYIIAGTGDDEARLRQCAADHGQSEAVIFAGFVPQEELAGYYRLCDAFVMPSTGEGFGIVYLEALASGRPCIVGNRDASPEAIDQGRLGFAVDPLSPPEIAEAVVRLLSHEHDKPWLHEPETLQKEAIRLFGFTAFKHNLYVALKRLLPDMDLKG